MDVIADPAAHGEELEELLEDLDYEPEEISIPGLPGEPITLMTVVQIPMELLLMLNELDAEISGRKIWPGSAFLASALCTPPAPVSVAGANAVLELGCGSGLAGICAARLGARRVVMTDGDQVSIDLLAKNLEANGLVGGGGGMADEAAVGRRLLWGRGEQLEDFRAAEAPPGGFELIIAADVMYKEILPPLLFATVKELLAPTGHCILCHCLRRNVTQEIVVAAAVDAGLEIAVKPMVDTAPFVEHCQHDEAETATLYVITHPAAARDAAAVNAECGDAVASGSAAAGSAAEERARLVAERDELAHDLAEAQREIKRLKAALEAAGGPSEKESEVQRLKAALSFAGGSGGGGVGGGGVGGGGRAGQSEVDRLKAALHGAGVAVAPGAPQVSRAQSEIERLRGLLPHGTSAAEQAQNQVESLKAKIQAAEGAAGSGRRVTKPS